jgi:FAD/FMN-containing dehydrogenase
MQNITNESKRQTRPAIRGEILFPGESGYEESRKIWNATADRHPAVIFKCLDNHDVVQAISYAHENKMIVAVRGGGHNVAGNSVCEGGVMIDLLKMNSITVDADNKIVRTGGGCLIGDVDKECQRYGLVVPGGIVSTTGLGGLTLGGGYGWTSRKFGHSIDNLLSATVVTADGKVLTASKDENPDLFWAIRGGGGNFGVVTSFEFRAHEIGTEVYSGIIVYPLESAKKYIQFHRDYVRTLPDDMTVWMVIRLAPPLPFLPESAHGKLSVIVPFAYLGDQKKGEELIRPVREFGKPVGEFSGMNPYAGWQTTFDAANTKGARNYWKGHHLVGLPDECIDKLLACAQKFPTEQCEIFIPHMEGAPSRVPDDATAYSNRKIPFDINAHARWELKEDDERCKSWARDFFESTKPFAQGVYVNFLSDEGEDRVRDAYTPETWKRLVELKTKYDPENFFRMNQNIRPSVVAV